MVRVTQAKADAEGLRNVRTCLRDFVAKGTGLASAGTDYAMLFNILHAECPDVLLAEAFRILSPGGILGVIHWNYDPTTPAVPRWRSAPAPKSAATGPSKKVSDSSNLE